MSDVHVVYYSTVTRLDKVYRGSLHGIEVSPLYISLCNNAPPVCLSVCMRAGVCVCVCLSLFQLSISPGLSPSVLPSLFAARDDTGVVLVLVGAV